MLKKRKPSNDDVHQWLETMNGTTGLPVSRVDPNHWQVGMRNPAGQYTMDIRDQGEWVTMATVLGRDVEGRKRTPFYRKLLELSGKLNGSHIGIQSDNVILSREEPKEDLDQLSFYRGMSLLDRGQEVASPEVLKEMKRNNLKPKRS